MTTQGFIICVVIICSLMIKAIIDNKREIRRAVEDERKARTRPSGIELPDEDVILSWKKADVEHWGGKDLQWFVNYVGHHAADEEDAEKKKLWYRLYEEVSRALYHY